MGIVILTILILTFIICFFYIKNIMKVNIRGNKTKIKLFFIIIIIIISVSVILYLSIELLYPRDFQMKGSIDGSTSISKLEKLEKNNHYYISFDKIKLECTKEQYDFVSKGKECYIYYRLNFFNRNTGKILKVDDKPIYYGDIQRSLNIIAYQTNNGINCYLKAHYQCDTPFLLCP